MKILTELALLAPKRRAAVAKDYAALAGAIGRIPNDLRALYAFSANLDRVDADEGLEWLSASGAVSNWKMQRKIVREFPAHVLPIATDGAGNFACYDTKTGRVVDWDHETRKVKALAPSLEKFVEKELVAPLRRQAKESSALAGAKQIRAGKGPSGLPSKVSEESFPLLKKVDRPSYGGGAMTAMFHGDDSLWVPFDQGGVRVKLGGKSELHVDAFGGHVVRVADRVLCVKFWELALFDEKGALAGRWCSEAIQHVVEVAASRDGHVAIGDTLGNISLWDVKKLVKGSTQPFAHSFDLPKVRPLAWLQGHQGWTFCRFSRDGAHLASGDANGRLCVWKGRKLVASARLADEIRGVDFSADGERIFVGLGSGGVEVRDRALKRVTQWKTMGDDVRHLRVLASGAVATLGHKLLRLWDPANGKLLTKIARKRGETSPRICDERGSLLVTAGPAALYRLVRIE